MTNQGLSTAELKLEFGKIHSKLEKYENLPSRVQSLEDLIKGDDKFGRKSLFTMLEENSNVSKENSEKITEILTIFRSFKTFTGWTFKAIAVVVTSGFIPLAYITIKRIIT